MIFLFVLSEEFFLFRRIPLKSYLNSGIDKFIKNHFLFLKWKEEI